MQSRWTAGAAARAAGGAAVPARPCPSMGSRPAMATEPKCAPSAGLHASTAPVSCRAGDACLGAPHRKHAAIGSMCDPAWLMYFCKFLLCTISALAGADAALLRGPERLLLLRVGAAEVAEADGEGGEQDTLMAPAQKQAARDAAEAGLSLGLVADSKVSRPTPKHATPARTLFI